MDLPVLVSRLAQYRPFDESNPSPESTVGELLQAIGAADGGRIGTLNEAVGKFRRTFSLAFSSSDLEPGANYLVGREEAEWIAEDLSLTSAAVDSLEAGRREFEALQSEAFRDWEKQLFELSSDLEPMEIAELRDDLERWIAKVITLHGAEAALLLYPNDRKSSEIYDKAMSDGAENSPKRGARVESIRDRAIHLFVRRPTSNQRRWLARVLGCSYFLTVLSIDPAATALVQKIVAGQTIYLDTNVVFRLLGLQGGDKERLIKRVLDLTISLGYQLRVTPWTITEYKKSLEVQWEYINNNPAPRADFAALAAEASWDQNFVTAYWQWRSIHPHAKSADFYGFYSEVETHLAACRVEVVSTGCKEIDADRRAIDRGVGVLGQLSSERRARPKSASLREHDVKHYLLVGLLRNGEQSRTFADASVWFLTADGVLPEFDRRMGSGASSRLAHIASTDSWFQVVRSLCPITTDYSETIAGLLASPYLTYKNRLTYKSTAAVVARVSQYASATPELAARVLVASAGVAEKMVPDQKEQRDELIDELVVETAKQLAVEYGRKEARLKENLVARNAEVARLKLEQERMRKRTEKQRERGARKRQAAPASAPAGGSSTPTLGTLEEQGRTDATEGSVAPGVSRLVGSVLLCLLGITALAVAIFTALGRGDIVLLITLTAMSVLAAIIVGLVWLRWWLYRTALSTLAVLLFLGLVNWTLGPDMGERTFVYVTGVLTIVGCFAAIFVGPGLIDKSDRR